MKVLILLTLLAAVAAMLAIIVMFVAARPRRFGEPPRPVLICASHSDDCVILGAEYATGTASLGLPIRIAYLTCVAGDPSSAMARTREAEAVSAWNCLGVDGEDLRFLNLPESEVDGPARYAPGMLQNAGRDLQAMVERLPREAAVIVPARGESHVDHRNMRAIALDAVDNSGRADLAVYEAAEYNNFISLRHSPASGIRALLSAVPVLNRLVRRLPDRAGFASGSKGMIFADPLPRLATKRRMLRHFASQDGDLLVRLFGYSTVYRRVSGRQRDESAAATGFRLFGRLTDWTIPAAAALALILVLLVGTWLGIALHAIGLAALAMTAGAIGAIVYGARAVRRNVSRETAVLIWTVCAGLVIGSL